MKPLITVVAVAYNQERWVAETLDSIKQQTYPNIQLIVADDGSTDQTKSIIQQWISRNCPEAIFLNHPVNRGIPQNYNTTLPFIKGAYVKLIGCDDVLLSNTLDVLYNTLSFLLPDYGVVYADMMCIDAAGKLISNTGIVEKRGHPTPSGDVYLPMITKPFVTAASILFKKEVLDKLGRFNEQVFFEDFDFYLRASKFFKFHFLPQQVVKYRVHARSQINSSSKLRYFINTFFVYYTNYDTAPAYKKLYDSRLLFCIKNLQALQCKTTTLYAFKALFLTRDLRFLKFSVLGVRHLLLGKKN